METAQDAQRDAAPVQTCALATAAHADGLSAGVQDKPDR